MTTNCNSRAQITLSLSLSLCSLLSSSLNGSDVTTIVEGLTAPDSIAIDFVHNYMYFTDWVEDKISRVKVYTLAKPQKLVTYTFGIWLTPPKLPLAA